MNFGGLWLSVKYKANKVYVEMTIIQARVNRILKHVRDPNVSPPHLSWAVKSRWCHHL